MKTWPVELAVVTMMVVLTAHLSGKGWIEYVGALAVVLTFCYAQVNDRMAEDQERRSKPSVYCWRWSRRYFVSKEIVWIAYFALQGAWSAIAGAVVFLLYPWWRSYYRMLKIAKAQRAEQEWWDSMHKTATKLPLVPNGTINIGWDEDKKDCPFLTGERHTDGVHGVGCPLCKGSGRVSKLLAL